MNYRRSSKAGVSLLEGIISIFLLAFAALGVLSMTESAFASQRRNEKILKANLVAQAQVAEIRAWAKDVNHFLGNWSAYHARTFPAPGYPEFTVSIRCKASGRLLFSPCEEMERQWISTPLGARAMPRAVVPVEVSVSWSADPKDRVQVLSLMGEPLRDTTGAVVTVSDPTQASLAMGQSASYTASVKDSAGRPFDNLLFGWKGDSRYVSVQGQRDGRTCHIKRDQVVVAPTLPPPTPPQAMPVNIYTRYAGNPIPMQAKGLLLP